MSSGIPLETAERLLDETRQHIVRADAKALTALQLWGGAGLAVLTVRSDGAAGGWLWWSGCGGWGLSLTLLAAAAAPRLFAGGPPEHVGFFGHVVHLRTAVRVQSCIEAAADEPLPRVVGQLRANSRIAMAKYRLIRAGAVLGLVSAAAMVVSLY